MPPALRRLALTAHIASSVGWLGSVAAFLALAIAGLTGGQDPQRAQGVYLAMELTGWYVIVPLAFTSLLTGLVQSLGTTWGLFRHYWVLMKLALTVAATFLLLLHMQVAGHVADAVAEPGGPGSGLDGLRIQLVADAAAAVLVLLVTTGLSVYKPRGVTRYGWRRQQEQRAGTATAGASAPARAR
ncbi:MULTISPECIES: hypothetical protein [unclassified Streptomyces]|uniref:hypothetical protein n=1 Tax=unclassified Streptomyces TaxID=2593676 RepID=UPI002365C600|nr:MULTISPECIES: hypothetical protein [unclassified Streptomyces]MDF3142088.1 hypothetical protein [Streptomyces sp. T21Q-yed]WDF43044.1 hypothetical protein PBV52_42770 [Streptomyces sp. T12]